LKPGLILWLQGGVTNSQRVTYSSWYFWTSSTRQGIIPGGVLRQLPAVQQQVFFDSGADKPGVSILCWAMRATLNKPNETLTGITSTLP